MRVLVTGATGFIGREITSLLVESGFELIAMGGASAAAGQTLFGKCENLTFITADISDKNDLLKLGRLGKIDALIHSAGLAHQFGETKREAFESVNVEGSRNIVNLALTLEAKHFILIGSTAVYGAAPVEKRLKAEKQSPPVTTEESETNPLNDYAESKLEGERVCIELCEKNNLPLTIFRLAPVIGEANVGNVARLIEAIDKKKFIRIGDGSNLKSLIYKRDVALACLCLLNNKIGRTEIFNLAAEPVLIREFVENIERELGRKNRKFYIPAGFPRFFLRLNATAFNQKKISKLGEVIEKWLADDIYSAEKIRRAYGFTPRTSIGDALEKQIGWYLDSLREAKK